MEKWLEEEYKKGNIKDIKEAFKEYPVREEPHKGDINYYLSERINNYGMYNIGDIVYVNEYKYPNGNIGNNHLFVIIDDINKAVPLEYFGMIISSKIEKQKYRNNVVIKKDKLNNLKENSIVKTDQIYILYKDNILFKIGEVAMEKIIKYKDMYKNFKNKRKLQEI